VYGAADPKAGAAGSTLDVFGHQKLNHQTSVIGGVLAEQCAEPLQAFFQDRRSSQRSTSDPLRVDALRTPDSNFNDLPGYPWPARYVKDLPVLAGLRMHFLDEGPVDAETTFLCLHGNPGWSYLYRKMLPIWVQANCRVIAPDLIGFGKSDKPKRSDFHSFTFHRQCLLELVDHLDLKGIVLVVQDWGGILGLTIPMDRPDRFKGVLVMNTLLATGDMPLTPGFLAWREMCAKHPEFDVGRLFMRANPHMTSSEAQAYNAPFPDAGHRAALRAFPNMVPEKLDSPGADLSRRARSFWSDTWTGKSLMVIGAMDPVLGSPTMHELHQHIRNCPKPIELAQAGHFVQEHGEPIAKMALNQFKLG
jgi:tRNA(adenine34) deaminase